MQIHLLGIFGPQGNGFNVEAGREKG